MGSSNEVRPIPISKGENVKKDISKNRGELIDTTYGGEGATMKVYIYDEHHRFVTLTSLSLGTGQLSHMLNKIEERRRELDECTEPMW